MEMVDLVDLDDLAGAAALDLAGVLPLATAGKAVPPSASAAASRQAWLQQRLRCKRGAPEAIAGNSEGSLSDIG